MPKKISVITICFNSEATVRQTIESVISQKTEEIEYILVDGGSNDGTLNIVNEYRNEIDQLISEPDNGISDAFNKGILISRGKYIAFLNSDDYYEPGCLSKICACIDSSNSDLIYGATIRVLESGIVGTKKSSKKLWLSLPFSHCSSFLKRSYFDRYGYFNQSIDVAMDIDLFLRGYRDVSKSVVEFVVANQRDGGVSDANRLRGYYQYFLLYALYYGFWKGLLGYVVKRLIYIANKFR